MYLPCAGVDDAMLVLNCRLLKSWIASVIQA